MSKRRRRNHGPADVTPAFHPVTTRDRPVLRVCRFLIQVEGEYPAFTRRL